MSQPIFIKHYLSLHALVERTRDNLQLMLAAQLDEVHSVTRYTDCQLWILLGVLHSIHKHLAVQYVHVKVVSILCEVTVHQGNKVLDTCLCVNTAASINPDRSGLYQVAGRIYAKNAKLPHRQDFELVRWL